MKCCISLQVMQTKTPENLSREIIQAFTNPPVIEELGRIASMNNKERISVKGEATRVSEDIHISFHKLING